MVYLLSSNALGRCVDISFIKWTNLIHAVMFSTVIQTHILITFCFPLEFSFSPKVNFPFKYFWNVFYPSRTPRCTVTGHNWILLFYYIFIFRLCIFNQPPATKASNRAPKGRAGKATKPATVPTPVPKTEEVPPSLYHGTVVPVEEFVVTKDVKSIHTSIGICYGFKEF